MLKTLSQIKLPVLVKKKTAGMNFQRMLNKQQTASLLIFDCGTSGPWTVVRVHNVLFELLHGIK